VTSFFFGVSSALALWGDCCELVFLMRTCGFLETVFSNGLCVGFCRVFGPLAWLFPIPTLRTATLFFCSFSVGRGVLFQAVPRASLATRWAACGLCIQHVFWWLFFSECGGAVWLCFRFGVIMADNGVLYSLLPSSVNCWSFLQFWSVFFFKSNECVTRLFSS